MVRALGGGHPHTPYISFEQLLVGWTATTHTVLWERSYGCPFTRKHTTTQPYRAVAPYHHWGRRGVLGISLKVTGGSDHSCSVSGPFRTIRSGPMNI